MTNNFLSKGMTLQSEPGPLASVDYVSPDEGISLVVLESKRPASNEQTLPSSQLVIYRQRFYRPIARLASLLYTSHMT
jgi:hypothetical protein